MEKKGSREESCRELPTFNPFWGTRRKKTTWHKSEKLRYAAKRGGTSYSWKVRKNAGESNLKEQKNLGMSEF